MKYICEYCNKTYKNANSLYSHRSKYHSNNTIDINKQKKKKVIKCNFCDSEFKYKNNKYRHQKTCKSNPNYILKSSESNSRSNNEALKPSTVEALIGSLSNSKSNNEGIKPSTVEALIKVLSQSIAKDSNNNYDINNQKLNNNNNNHNHSHNKTTTINNNVIVALGNENIPYQLTAQEQQNILKQKSKALEELIKLVHFSNKYPQFHNIAIDDDIAYKYDDKLCDFTEVSKDDLIHDIIELRVDDISEINWLNKLNVHNDTYSYIDNYISQLANTSNTIKAKEITENTICHGTQSLLNAKKLTLKNNQ